MVIDQTYFNLKKKETNMGNPYILLRGMPHLPGPDPAPRTQTPGAGRAEPVCRRLAQEGET